MSASEISLEGEGLAARDAAELLYLHGVGGLFVTAVAGTSLVAILPNALARSRLMIWLGVMLAILTLRMIDLLASRTRRAAGDWDGRAEIRRYACGVLATAAMWALFPLLFFRELDQVERTTMAIIVSAMAGGSATVLAPELRLAVTYCAALLVPASVMFSLTPGRENAFIGALGIVFFFVLANASKVTHRVMLAAIRLNRANQSLMAERERDRRRTEDANAELRAAQGALSETLETLEDRIKERTIDLEREVQERERYGRELARLASTDSLTGLDNRSTLADRLGIALLRAEHAQVPLAVLFLDLDKFKEVNDVKGHEAGDGVLRTVAHRVRAIVPAGSVAARWGGDEFVVVLNAIDDRPTATEIGMRLRESVSEPVPLGADSVRVDATIGIALYPDHGRTPDELIRAADMAMYAGKEDGRGHVRIFDPALADALRSRHLLEQSLRSAIVSNALRLEFQPIVAARSRRCGSLEALLRWDHPLHGPIAPAEFIPLAERSGDIVGIGRWVLAHACEAAAHWPGDPPPAVSVNVSVAQILGGSLIDDVRGALAAAAISARRLHLEVTESLFASDHERVIPTLRTLREMGVRISLDDFGTGFSSLGALRSLPIDVIKIDKSFIANMEGESGPIIKAIRSLCGALDIELIAEGVESASQAALLVSLGVRWLQGFLFARPLPDGAVTDWLAHAGNGESRLANTASAASRRPES